MSVERSYRDEHHEDEDDVHRFSGQHTVQVYHGS
jgi:hypothetical protein